MSTKTDHIYAIRDRTDGQYVVCNSHCAWKSPARAKVSWGIAFMASKQRQKAFDKQDQYEIIKL